jgi:hypothetical protein
MSVPATITPMLSKLIPRLASNHAGEVVATAAAIGRLLTANKLDWHDLTAAVLDSPAKTVRPAREADDDSAWRDLVGYCTLRASRLNGREREFVVSLAKWKRTPTEKQLAWLEAIAAKLRGGTA